MTKNQKIKAYRESYKLYSQKLITAQDLALEYWMDEVSEMFCCGEFIYKYKDVNGLNETILLSCAELVRLDFKIE